MIHYLGKVNANTFEQHVHNVTEPRNMLCVYAKLLDGIAQKDLCLLQYSIVPQQERANLSFSTWMDSPLGLKAQSFIQYSQPRAPIASVRLKPVSGEWEFVVREMTSDEITLNEAAF